jgi:hypothetical protein
VGQRARVTSSRVEWRHAAALVGAMFPIGLMVVTRNMRRIPHLLSLLLLTWLAVTLTACEVMPDPEFAVLKNALGLRLVEAKRRTDSVDLSFELTNRGRTTATACLGPSRSLSYTGSSIGGTNISFVDHPGCAREFSIQSGNAMLWEETFEIDRLPDGRVKVEVSVQIVNPRRCGGWGDCADFHLTSNQVEVP